MNDIEQGIKNVLESLADTFEAGKQANFGELAERILESEHGALWWKTPENFSVGFVFPAEQALEVAIEKRYPGADARTIRTLVAIHAHYTGIKKHLERLIEHFEGFGAVADKSRRLINAYVTWLTTGKTDDFKDRKDPDKRGWDCPSVGTPAQWHNLIKGILFFYTDGATVEPFMPYRELLLLYQEKHKEEEQ
ncbi:hypothetical protein [Desulfitobacterium sp.]|uniref:hypothetical protein n=1 Tax=Desulfitobacterium sp. TaxID=49981 RepID=UPI002B220369|nr:hypothetical protein [Desulfitobacterium sp.]MEA4901874.1 hypothetical protein [Desulfitobacterium sp.]